MMQGLSVIYFFMSREDDKEAGELRFTKDIKSSPEV